MLPLVGIPEVDCGQDGHTGRQEYHSVVGAVRRGHTVRRTE